MAFIRKFKTASGATGVQVCWKQGGEVVRTEHIGSANSELALRKLLKEAERVKLGEGQRALFRLDTYDDMDEPLLVGAEKDGERVSFGGGEELELGQSVSLGEGGENEG